MEPRDSTSRREDARAARPLALREERELPAQPPFHFAGTVFKPSHFPSPDGAFDGRRRWQTLRLGGETLGICLRAGGSARRPGVHVGVYAARRISRRLADAVAAELSVRLDLACDLTAFEAACGRDRLLGPVLERWRGMRVSALASLYEFLVITTVLQNTTVRRSVQMMRALFGRFGRRVTFDGRALEAFWDPARLDAASEQELRALKLGYRARILKRQAAAITAGACDADRLRTRPTPEVKEALLGLYGVGPASVGYLLFEVFKRHGAWDHVSPWEQRIFSRLLFDAPLVAAARILAEAERRWGPWKMLAAHYLFEDLFWRRQAGPIPWLDAIVRL